MFNMIADTFRVIGLFLFLGVLWVGYTFGLEAMAWVAILIVFFFDVDKRGRGQ